MDEITKTSMRALEHLQALCASISSLDASPSNAVGTLDRALNLGEIGEKIARETHQRVEELAAERSAR